MEHMRDTKGTRSDRKPRGSSFHPTVEKAIRELGDEQRSAPFIFAELRRRYGKHHYAMPTSVKTIERRLSRQRGNDTSPPWTLESTEVPEVQVVLRALAAVIELTEGRKTYLTTREARVIVAICRAAPEIRPLDAYSTAREYIAATSDDDARGVTAKIALGGVGRDDESLNRWYKAVKAGWIPGRFATWLAAALDEMKRDNNWKGTYRG